MVNRRKALFCLGIGTTALLIASFLLGATPAGEATVTLEVSGMT